jgi:hypothetical protein
MLSLFALIVSIFGFFGLMFSLRQTYRARLRQFEGKYVERYWTILDNLSLAALSISDQAPDDEDRKNIRKYILLCEDELQMRGNGYIADSTYEEWADGMITQFAQPMFKRVWESVEKEWDSKEPGAFPYKNLRKLLSAQDRTSGGNGDLLAVKMGKPSRMVRGLTGIGAV